MKEMIKYEKHCILFFQLDIQIYLNYIYWYKYIYDTIKIKVKSLFLKLNLLKTTEDVLYNFVFKMYSNKK